MSDEYGTISLRSRHLLTALNDWMLTYRNTITNMQIIVIFSHFQRAIYMYINTVISRFYNVLDIYYV